ncbi:hypothetical protein JCM10213_006883 [Rhodosporidiobolus nylandii]
MDSEALKHLADTRAQSDVKLLKKTIKEFYALLSPSLSAEELQAAHATFLIGLDQLKQHLAKKDRVEAVAAWEVDEYRRDAAALETSSLETRSKLTELEARLQRAQQDRARRIEYDAKAREIAKVVTREKGEESLARLTSDLSSLCSEASEYAQTWAQRHAAFSEIVSALGGMMEGIRDEKAEQARRRALDDADGEDEDAAGGTASAPMTAQTSLDPNAKPFVPGEAAPPTAEGGGEGGEDVEMRDQEQEQEGGEGQEAQETQGSREDGEEREDGEV